MCYSLSIQSPPIPHPLALQPSYPVALAPSPATLTPQMQLKIALARTLAKSMRADNPAAILHMLSECTSAAPREGG